MLVMGILNVTPDSFSDGGAHAGAGPAIEAGLRMAAEGAGIVDVGGESTRPGAVAVPPEAELARVLPVVAGLARAGVRVSVDTRNAATMAACLDAGAAMINDVSALTHDRESAGVVAGAGCPVILMHMRGTPATMDQCATYQDVVAEVAAALAARRDAAVRAGVAAGRIWLDPGLGFAKTAAQNWALLRGLAALKALGAPLVVGASRKRFIDGDAAPADRLGGSIAVALAAADSGAAMVRVHDVRQTVQALRVWGALRG
jgi:dihydropteroate synthase